MMYLEAMYRKGTDTLMAKRYRTKRQTIIDETQKTKD